MKKGQIYEGFVEKVNFPNKGVVRVGEETCIVKNSLPGQKIRLCVNKVRNGRAEARLVEILEKSSLETAPTCSYFGVCGGCTYLSLPYGEQLRIKEQQVKMLLDSVLTSQGDWRFEGIKGSPVYYEYRNKMEFSFGDAYKDGPLALGMHKRGSFYDVVTVSDCMIVDPDYRLILKTVRDYFGERNVTFFHRLRHEGYLRHLLVRKASKTGEILVALVTTSQDPWPGQDFKRQGSPEDLIHGFCQSLLKLQQDGCLEGSFKGILHITNDSLADVVKSDRTDVLYGSDYFEEELLGLNFRISTFSFFQTNSYSAEVLYQTAREYVGDLDGMGQDGKKPTVFDLYSGTGTIAQLMAPVAGKVIGVEIVEEAVEAARRNAAQNGLTNCEFIAGDVLKVLNEVEEKPDLIILDPPRDGIHPKALPKILAYGVERIVYISCKPDSLVRDLDVFLDGGYRVEKAVAVDQFPNTANVEVICLLRKCREHLKADNKLTDRFVFRSIHPDEAEQAVAIEKICFPPNEACSEKSMKERIQRAPELFLVAVDKKTGKLAGFLNGLSTNEDAFRDAFFTDADLYDPAGKNVMLLGLDVLPEYRGQGLAGEIVRQYVTREKENGRRMLVLTCLDSKVAMYQRMGFQDKGMANSTWGGEAWHEMTCPIGNES